MAFFTGPSLFNLDTTYFRQEKPPSLTTIGRSTAAFRGRCPPQARRSTTSASPEEPVSSEQGVDGCGRTTSASAEERASSEQQHACSKESPPEPVLFSRPEKRLWNSTNPYVGVKWNVPCCWDTCDPPMSDPLFKPKFNAKDGKVDRRRVATKCGRGTYHVGKGMPYNPAGKTGYAGLGYFRRWGPNFYVKVLLTMKQKDQMYVLCKKNSSSYFEGFVDDVENEFPKNLQNLLEQYLYEDNVPEKERKMLIQEARKSSEQYLSGSIPHPWNTDNAWIEIINYLVRCEKNQKVCNAFVKHDREDHVWRPWSNVHTIRDMVVHLKRHQKHSNITLEYSAHCTKE
uniref:Uncharacterized protein n=1 Tax=Trichuris muris TaxID=70415 RepID=A0A5S6Q1Z0_TRIMR